MQIEHKPDESRFTMKLPGGVAFLEYDQQDGVLEILHTIVPERERGQGKGAMLVEHAVGYAREHGLEIEPTCWYARQWLEAHPQT